MSQIPTVVTDATSSSVFTGESRARSILKGLTWRVLATVTTVAIVWLITGEVALALEVGAVEVVAKLVVYYGHERIWAHVPFGIHKKLT